MATRILQEKIQRFERCQATLNELVEDLSSSAWRHPEKCKLLMETHNLFQHEIVRLKKELSQ